MSDRELGHTDLSLLERMGDSRMRFAAWDDFVARYTRIFFRWFRKWDVDPTVMEDLLQETFLRVLGNVDRFERRRDGSFRAWLKITAYNCWRQLNKDATRQLAQRPAISTQARNWGMIQSKLAQDSLMELFDAWATEELIATAHSRARVYFDQATWDTYRRVVLERQPVQSILETEEIAAKTVYNRIFRVRLFVRNAMAELDPAVGDDQRLENEPGNDSKR